MGTLNAKHSGTKKNIISQNQFVLLEVKSVNVILTKIATDYCNKIGKVVKQESLK